MRLFLYFLLTTIIFSCTTPEKNKIFFPADNEKYVYSGRYSVSNEGIELINSAASVKAVVSGDSLLIQMESGNEQHHYVSVQIGEDYRGRFEVDSEPLKFALPENPNATLVTLYKDTEASNGSILFKGIVAEKIEVVEQEEKPTIEFIGDSITCGMGADTREIPCEDGEWYDQHNAYFAYGPRVARALNTDFVLNCVSGMGMYRNWNDEDQFVIGNVYPTRRLNGDTTEMAERKGSPPSIVSIALGTNDLSMGDGVKERTDFDQDAFTRRYIEFVEMIFRKYPETKVALLSSPMIGKKENELLVNSLNKVKEHFNDKEIFIFEFEQIAPGGCTSHPDIEDHREMANMLIPFYKELLK